MGVKFVDPSPEARSPDRRVPRARGRLDLLLRVMTRASRHARRSPSLLLAWRPRPRAPSPPTPSRSSRAKTLKPPAGEGYFDDVFAPDPPTARRVAADPHRRRHVRQARALRRGHGQLADVVRPAGEVAGPGRHGAPARRQAAWSSSAARSPTIWRRFTRFASTAPENRPARSARRPRFGRPPADGTARAKLLVAFDRKLGTKGAEATFTVTPYDLTTLAPAGKPRVHKIDVTGELKPPGAALRRLLRRLHAHPERTPGRIRQEGRRAPAAQDGGHRRHQRQGGRPKAQIADIVGLGADRTAQAQHPGRSVFVELNEDGSGVDVVDAMGKKQPADAGGARSASTIRSRCASRRARRPGS